MVKKSRGCEGFTLIELIVVIGIIGILSTIVLANLNGSRQKARDSKRVADIKQLQLSLALYFDSRGKYPGALLSGAGELAPIYIPSIPVPPGGVDGVTSYSYVPLNTACNSYHLGAALEQSTSLSLVDDADAPPGQISTPINTACATPVTASADFHGRSTDCQSSGAAATEQCFDVTP